MVNLQAFSTAFLVLTAAALILYGLHGPLDAALGVKESLLDSVWPLLALAWGGALLAGFGWPFVRGVRAGDQLLAVQNQQHRHANNGLLHTLVNSFTVTAQQNGYKGQVIRVNLPQGGSAKARILDYAGLLSPASAQLLETEVEIVFQ